MGDILIRSHAQFFILETKFTIKFLRYTSGARKNPRKARTPNLKISLPNKNLRPNNPNLRAKSVPAMIKSPFRISPFICCTSFILPSASASSNLTTFNVNHPPVSIMKKFINLPNPNSIFALTLLTGAIKAAWILDSIASSLSSLRPCCTKDLCLFVSAADLCCSNAESVAILDAITCNALLNTTA